MLSERVIYWLGYVLLTVGAAVHLHSEAHPATGVPVERDEAKETGSHRVGQLVLDNGLRIHIPDKTLQVPDRKKKMASMTAAEYSDSGRKHERNSK